MGRRIALFAMSTPQKFHALRQVAAELVVAGAEVCFWTDAKFEAEVRAIGAQFVDLFDPLSLASIDDASLPVPSRYVTFAAARAGAISDVVRESGADVVVYDSFTLVGEAVARRLGLPWVPVFSGHLIDGAAARRKVASEPRVMTDPRCATAVSALADDFGIVGVTPFSYFADPSPWLNIACEPEEWLGPAERQKYQPLACFGKLPMSVLAPVDVAQRKGSRLRIYAAFGTVIWWYWSRQAAAVFEAIAEAAREADAELVIGLGGGTLPGTARQRLEALGAVVHDYANQAVELASADVFITHAGASSVHEAIAATVPMLLLPFSADQPAIAAHGASLGIAISLADDWTPDQGLKALTVRRKLDELLARREHLLEALRRARAWELAAATARPAIARRILDL